MRRAPSTFNAPVRAALLAIEVILDDLGVNQFSPIEGSSSTVRGMGDTGSVAVGDSFKSSMRA